MSTNPISPERHFISKSNENRFRPVKGHPGIYKRVMKDGTVRWGTKGYDPSVGKTIWLGTFGSRSEAKRSKRQFEDRAKNSGFRRARTINVAQYASQWPESHPKRRAASTMQTYREGVKRFVADFGTVRIRDLDRSVCVKWAETQPDWVVNATRIMLTDMCQTDNLIPSNPLENLQRIYSRGRKDWPVLGDVEVVGLIESALVLFEPEVGRSIAGIIATSAYMGLRKSEAVALSLDCVDPVSKRVLVDLQVGRKRAETGPKSGTRLIALTPKTLEAWHRLSPVAGPASMFPMPDGRYWEVSNFYVRWSKVATASGIPGLQFHELRHHCATWLKRQGVDEWAIAVQLGHAMSGNRTTQGYIKARNIALQHIDEVLASEPIVLEPEGRAEFKPQRLHRLDSADAQGRNVLDKTLGRQELRKKFMKEAKNNRDGANFRDNQTKKVSGDQE